MGGRATRQREFFEDVPEGAIRLRFDAERGRVTAFTVQLECWIEDDWHPVARYDSAHGRPHRDTLDWDGRVVAKDWLPHGLSLNEAMEYARRDLQTHVATYRDEFLRRRLGR